MVVGEKVISSNRRIHTFRRGNRLSLLVGRKSRKSCVDMKKKKGKEVIDTIFVSTDVYILKVNLLLDLFKVNYTVQEKCSYWLDAIKYPDSSAIADRY